MSNHSRNGGIRNGGSDDCLGVSRANTMRRVQLLSTIPLSETTCPPCLAGQHAFGPRVTKFSVTCDGVMGGVPIGVLLGFGRRDTYRSKPCIVGSGLPCILGSGRFGGEHATREIDPDEPVNMPTFFALDRTQTVLQSFCLKDVAPANIKSMLVTFDTSHLEMSPLNRVAP